MNFLFTSYPTLPESDTKMYITLGLGLVLLLMFVVAPTLRKKTESKALQKIWLKPRGVYLGLGLGLLLFTWLRLEKVPLLSMQIWWLFLIIAVVTVFAWRTRKYLALSRRIERADARRKKDK